MASFRVHGARVTALLLCAWAGVCTAEAPSPATRLTYRVMAGGRYNPLGLGAVGRLALRHRIYESQSVLLRDNAVTLAALATVSPAFAREGAMVEVAPVSFLTLFGSWERMDYFGTSGFFQSFPSAASNTGPGEILRRLALPTGSSQSPYATGGQQVTAGAAAAVQWREYFLREQARWSWAQVRLRAGDRVFQDPNVDLVMPNGGWAFINDLDAGWTDGRLTLSVGWTCQKALFDSADYLPGERATAAQGFRHRVGPSATYTWAQPRGSRFVPSVFLQVQWWLAHPYRTGQDSPQAVPWVLAAFSASGDIL